MPFVAAGCGVIGALLLNVIPLVAFVWQLHRWLEDDLRASAALASLLTGLIVISTDLIGLAFMGMEALLQVWICLVVCRGIWRTTNGASPDRLARLGVIVGPVVRYELLALSAVALAVEWWQARRTGQMAAVALLMLAPLTGFSAFLVSRGLAWLPDSVLVKATQFDVEPHLGLVPALVRNAIGNVTTAEGTLLCAVALVAVLGGVRREGRVVYAAAALGVLLAQLSAGEMGWFGRYAAWSLVTVGLLAACAWSPLDRWSLPASRFGAWIATACLLLLSASGIRNLLVTPLAANNFYSQQYQMGRIVRELGARSIAVNDIGLVAWLNPGVYALDVLGLASPEAMERRRCCEMTAEWLEEISAKHHVELALIYDGWYSSRVPGWRKVGELQVIGRLVRLGARSVAIYATPIADPRAVEQALASMSFPATARIVSVVAAQ